MQQGSEEGPKVGDGGGDSIVSAPPHKNIAGRFGGGDRMTPLMMAEKKEVFIKSMKNGGFTPGPCAEAAGIDRTTAFRWKEADADFSARWDAAFESCLDRIEGNLRGITDNLNQPHKVTAAMFLLNGYRRDRFMPMSRMEHTGPGGGPILLAVAAKIQKMDTEELRVELGKLLGPGLVEVADPNI